MERLTNKREADAQREGYERRLANGYQRSIPVERFLRLAAYEDTGLMPNDVTDMMAANCNAICEIMKLKEELQGAKNTAEQYAADVVPVVRCKGCKHFKHYGKTSLLIDGEHIKAGWCYRRVRYNEEYRMPPDGFCSYGERKDDADV